MDMESPIRISSEEKKLKVLLIPDFTRSVSSDPHNDPGFIQTKAPQEIIKEIPAYAFRGNRNKFYVQEWVIIYQNSYRSLPVSPV